MYEKVVALYGVPRSGTSWLGQILDSCPNIAFRYQPLFSYRFKDRIKVNSKYEDIKLFFDELYDTNDDEFINQISGRKKGLYSDFKIKNIEADVLAYKEVRYLYTIPILLRNYPSIKIIGIVRNPYDVLESWINAPSEFKHRWNIYDEWYFGQSKNDYLPENYFGFFKWKECIKLFMDFHKKFREQFLLIKYEDLEEDALKTSQLIFGYIGIKLDTQTIDFIKQSQSITVKNASSVFRKKGENRLRQVYLPEDIKGFIKQDISSFPEANELGYY